MEYIQYLLNLVQDNFILSIVVGFLVAFVESFIPMLPLVAIVTANAAIFGMINGLIISWLGSVSGSIALFLVVSFLNEKSKILKKINKGRVQKAILWMDEIGFRLLFIAYACPFLPACAVTIASAISKRDLPTFVSALFSGKFIMFLVVSYIGHDIYGFITSPLKVIAFILIVLLAWKIGNRLNSELDNIEESRALRKMGDIKDDENIK